jgi:hypothetical protein
MQFSLSFLFSYLHSAVEASFDMKRLAWSRTLLIVNPLPSGTLAGPIQHTKEGEISREKTILMTSLRLERAAAVR